MAITVNGDRYCARTGQDSATCHTAETTIDVLRPGFEDLIISHRAVSDKPETIDTLKDNIRKAVGEIYNVLKNWTDRVGYNMAT